MEVGKNFLLAKEQLDNLLSFLPFEISKLTRTDESYTNDNENYTDAYIELIPKLEDGKSTVDVTSEDKKNKLISAITKKACQNCFVVNPEMIDVFNGIDNYSNLNLSETTLKIINKLGLPGSLTPIDKEQLAKEAQLIIADQKGVQSKIIQGVYTEDELNRLLKKIAEPNAVHNDYEKILLDLLPQNYVGKEGPIQNRKLTPQISNSIKEAVCEKIINLKLEEFNDKNLRTLLENKDDNFKHELQELFPTIYSLNLLTDSRINNIRETAENFLVIKNADSFPLVMKEFTFVINAKIQEFTQKVNEKKQTIDDRKKNNDMYQLQAATNWLPEDERKLIFKQHEARRAVEVCNSYLEELQIEQAKVNELRKKISNLEFKNADFIKTKNSFNESINKIRDICDKYSQIEAGYDTSLADDNLYYQYAYANLVIEKEGYFGFKPYSVTPDEQRPEAQKRTEVPSSVELLAAGGSKSNLMAVAADFKTKEYGIQKMAQSGRQVIKIKTEVFDSKKITVTGLTAAERVSLTPKEAEEEAIEMAQSILRNLMLNHGGFPKDKNGKKAKIAIKGSDSKQAARVCAALLLIGGSQKFIDFNGGLRLSRSDLVSHVSGYEVPSSWKTVTSNASLIEEHLSNISKDDIKNLEQDFVNYQKDLKDRKNEMRPTVSQSKAKDGQKYDGSLESGQQITRRP